MFEFVSAFFIIFSRDLVVLSNMFSYISFASSILFLILSISLFKSFISSSLLSLYLIARVLSSLNLFDKSSNFFFCATTLFFKSKCSSIRCIAVINKSLFSPIFPNFFFNSKYLLSKKEVNFFKDFLPDHHRMKEGNPFR